MTDLNTNPSDRLSWPTFLAFCQEADRFDAFIRGVSALIGDGYCTLVHPDQQEKLTLSATPGDLLPKAAERIRDSYESPGWVKAYFDFAAASGRKFELWAAVSRDRRRKPGFASLDVGFSAKAFHAGMLLPDKLPRLKREHPASLMIEAGIAWVITVRDVFDILRRFCTASQAITTGCCVEGPDWSVPITAAGSYHADGYPGRDLALSWIRLFHKEPIDLAAGLVRGAPERGE